MQNYMGGQYSSSNPVTPNDTDGTANAVNCRALYATGAGNITFKAGPIGARGPSQTVALAAGGIFPIELNDGQVLATGTTATGILALA